jgi:hypothetical protein
LKAHDAIVHGRIVHATSQNENLRVPDAKLDEQQEFVGWWAEHVVGRGNPAKKSPRLKNAERGALNVEHAEELTGLTQQQVSKWRKRLEKRAEYQASLFGSRWCTTQQPGSVSGSRSSLGLGNGSHGMLINCTRARDRER